MGFGTLLGGGGSGAGFSTSATSGADLGPIATEAINSFANNNAFSFGGSGRQTFSNEAQAPSGEKPPIDSSIDPTLLVGGAIVGLVVLLAFFKK